VGHSSLIVDQYNRVQGSKVRARIGPTAVIRPAIRIIALQ
jgi:hypothetical protein